MKVFGKELFTVKKPAGQMYDFAMHGILENNHFSGLVDGPMQATTEFDKVVPTNKKPIKEKPKKSPKQLFKMKSLNDNNFTIIATSEYLRGQIMDIEEKLAILGPVKKKKKTGRDAIFIDSDFELGGVKFGRDELNSILERLRNRFRISEFEDILQEYPHTSNTLIIKLIKENSHLRTGRAVEFVPDFPKDAIRAMKEYNDMCIELCNKKTNFYVIAKHEDFQRKNTRRDPILIAQSPFGFFWQILGAWDEEMIYLGDL